jgi:hypothetical protein
MISISEMRELLVETQEQKKDVPPGAVGTSAE